MAATHVNAIPVIAWVVENLKLPIGLQTTMYLSMASTTSDQRATSPVWQVKYTIHLHPTFTAKHTLLLTFA